MEQQQHPEWKTPRSFFGKASQRAFDKFDACGGSVVSFTDTELSALCSNTWFEDIVEVERDRRRAAAAREAEWRKQAAPGVHQQAAPALRRIDKVLFDRLATAFSQAWIADDLAAWKSCVTEHRKTLIDLEDLTALVVIPMFEILKANRARGKRLDAVEVRLSHVEARPMESEAELPDKGVWNGLQPYAKGDCVTDRGSYWRCREANLSQRPGSAATAQYWRLAAKGGVGVVASSHAGAIDGARISCENGDETESRRVP